jgi:Protein of unknown function (DUF1214)
MKRRAFLLNAAVSATSLAMSGAHALNKGAIHSLENQVNKSPLITADEIAVEALAIELIQSPQFVRQKEACRQRLLADPAAGTTDGKMTLDQALDDLAYASALGGANSDPTRPKVTWTLAAARKSSEPNAASVPSSRYLIDNPDNIYRFVTVDGNSRYEIDVRGKQPGPAQYSFMLHDTMFSENTKKNLADLDQPIAGLRDLDIKTNADGSFTVTVDSDPANGRGNHLQSNADARIIWIRNSLDDWSRQHTQEITVRRVGGPALAPPATHDAMATQAAAILKGGTDWLLALMNKTFGHVAQPNIVSKLFGRGGSWGYAARANFKLADDEALLVDLAPPPAKSYLGFQLTDPWQVSCEYITANGSLNNTQAEQNKDGSYTYVVSAKDPGIHNWLDTERLHEGGLLIRWQALPDKTILNDDVVRRFELVKLDRLSVLLPAETTRISSEQRKKLYAQRALTYAHRYMAN